MPAPFVVTGSPVTTAGTLTVTGGPVDWRYQINRLYMFTGGASASVNVGFTLISLTGPSTLATTSWLASTPRGVNRTAAGATTQVLTTFGSPAWVWLGNAADRGGFRYEFTIGLDLATATTRLAVGLGTPTPSLTGSEPSAAPNVIMFGQDSGDAQMQIMSNDAAGTCTKVALGAGMPASTTGCAWRVVFTAARQATSVDWSVTRLDNNSYTPVTGTIAAGDLPSSTTIMSPFIGIGNGATASAAGVAIIKVFGEEYTPA